VEGARSLSEPFLYDINPYTSARQSYNDVEDYQPMSSVRHILAVEDTEGQRLLPLESTSHSIGRDSTNSIVLKSKAVSRQHALLLRVTSSDPNNYGFLIIDVNGKKCHSHRLKNGDQLLLGNLVKIRYLILPLLTDEAFVSYSQNIDYTELFAEQSAHQLSISANAEADQFDEASLVRLASFPEIIPSPIFEVNLNGT
jgi:pSer/pThr/pTyr-binding forkhead associated (FHA) protein